MSEDVLRNFSRVLAVQSAAVQQHFIHVLMLGAWGEEAAAERIASIDAIDLHDLLLAERCRAAARRAAVAQHEKDLAGACNRIEAYYGELTAWRPGRTLPRLDNPCVGFERVLREYVWSGGTGSASSA